MMILTSTVIMMMIDADIDEYSNDDHDDIDAYNDGDDDVIDYKYSNADVDDIDEYDDDDCIVCVW